MATKSVFNRKFLNTALTLLTSRPGLALLGVLLGGAGLAGVQNLYPNNLKKELQRVAQNCSGVKFLEKVPKVSTPQYDHTTVLRLWANPCDGSSIKVRFIDEGSEKNKYYRIIFNNGNVTGISSFASDATIRPNGNQMMDSVDKRLLFVSARVATSPDVDTYFVDSEKNPLSELLNDKTAGMTIRVIDAKGTQWHYQGPVDPNQQSSKDSNQITNFPLGKEFVEFTLRLSNKDDWVIFTEDGNRIHNDHSPDFDSIIGIVIEVGKHITYKRPGPGRGVVDIKGFRLE